jgi:IS30 family transposase
MPGFIKRLSARTSFGSFSPVIKPREAYAKAREGRIPNRVSIHERPEVVQANEEFGHWEGDLMAFMKHTQHILVLRERQTMFTLSLPLAGKKAPNAALALIRLLKGLPPQARKTLTLDNGGEFAAHQTVFKNLGVPSYFCDPYASWQKGGIENTNSRLRRDLPRKTNIQTMQQKEFNETIQNYNMSPRKNSIGSHQSRPSTQIYIMSHFKLECARVAFFALMMI